LFHVRLGNLTNNMLHEVSSFQQMVLFLL